MAATARTPGIQLALGILHIDWRLRIHVQIARLYRKFLLPVGAQCVQHLQRRDDAVADAVFVETDDVAEILAAELPVLLLQKFHQAVLVFVQPLMSHIATQATSTKAELA